MTTQTQPAAGFERDTARPAPAVEAQEPVFGFMLFGGPITGARIRDVRLANELADRGYPVHVWWVMDRDRQSALRPQIRQHWLCHSTRYVTRRGSDLADRAGRAMTLLFKDKNRQRTTQRWPGLVRFVMTRFVQRVCESVEGDPRLVRRFAEAISEARVTHMMPMLALLSPWVQAARRQVTHRLRYLVTFQGYELYVGYAAALGREEQLYGRLREAVEQSDWPAVAVSADYVKRVVADIGIPESSLVAIPPGIPPFTVDPGAGDRFMNGRFPGFRPGVPLVSFLGRRDSEKGIDLLLYAAAMLRRRGVEFQLAVCGPTLFGTQYERVCRQLAENLRCPVLWTNQISDEERSALYVASRCIVYPSIHREPFGMVAVEALAHGTPAIVPDFGGIAEAIEADGEVGGLHFRVWDSSDLAEQLGRILTDDALHRRLSEAGPRVAAWYSVERLADRVLAHMGLPPRLNDR